MLKFNLIIPGWLSVLEFRYRQYTVTSAACTGWGLHNEDFLVIHRCVLSCLACTSSPLVWPLFHVVVRFLPCCCKKVIEGASTYGVVLEIAFVFLLFSRNYSCLSRLKICSSILESFMIMLHFDFVSTYKRPFFVVCMLFPCAIWQHDPRLTCILGSGYISIDFIFYGFCCPSSIRGRMHKSSCCHLSKRRSNSPRRVLG